MQEVKKPKVILTGGHLSPLLAVLERLSSEADCVVVGRRQTFEEDETESLEFKVLREKKIPFYSLKTGRLQRKIGKHTFKSLLKTPSALFAARRIINREKPDVVLTFGGYIGFPVSVAAYTKGVPVVLHEQTMHAGLTNKIIGKIAKSVCISFPSSAPFFPAGKTIFTGNPLRKEIFSIEKKIDVALEKPLLYVTGGSTGAHAINEFVELLLPKLLEHFSVIHQTGDSKTYGDFESLSKLRQRLEGRLQKDYVIRKFIMPEELGWIYKNSEIVVSRAGANTVSELISLNKKALLIPLPYGQGSEQLMNAKYYEESGLGVFIEQKDVRVNTLLDILLKLEKKKTAAKSKDVKNDAAEKIVNEVFKAVSS